ncbi:uroporphyrinogen decarboxylase family protein [Planctomycetota bacterium]
MTERERVLAALEFRPVDVPPVMMHQSAGGLYEHGEKLAVLMREMGHDFGDLSSVKVPDPPPPGDFDANGEYDVYRTDDWGIRWHYRTFGVWGVPAEYPLRNLEALADLETPALPWSRGPQFEAAKAGAARHREHYFRVSGAGSIFEQMHSLRPFEDVIVEIMTDEPAINRLADMLTEYSTELVRRAVNTGTDAVSMGDDFGTQQAMIFPPEVWRRFFKPRYRRIFAPAIEAGVKIFFHCCGCIEPILEDLAELGVNAVWPQLNLWDFKELAGRSKELGLAIQLHPDRGDLMQRGTPAQIRDYMMRMNDAFDIRGGGSFIYMEIDPGFPWGNVRALFEAVKELRAG